MFTIPTSLPLRNSSVEELTDYIEWECIKTGKPISLYSTLRKIYYSSDEITIKGDDDDDKMISQIDDISVEVGRRIAITDDKYPFTLGNSGYTFGHKVRNNFFHVYVYLLLSTRLNMKTHRTWGKVDGTKILEELAAVTAENYFGDRATGIVFGTAAGGNFQERINQLINQYGEGHSFIKRDQSRVAAQDDKLDVVVWKDFSDKKRSKLAGFGQCKTGTSWDDQALLELQPELFCDNWFRDHPVSRPVKLFFSSQYFPLDDYTKMRRAGIIFDRFRILDYLPSPFSRSLLEKIRWWNSAALAGIPSIAVI